MTWEFTDWGDKEHKSTFVLHHCNQFHFNVIRNKEFSCLICHEVCPENFLIMGKVLRAFLWIELPPQWIKL